MWWDFVIFASILICGFWALNELIGGYKDRKDKEDEKL